MMIPFNKPAITGEEINYISQSLDNNKLCGDNHFGYECQAWFEVEFDCKKALLTPNCTQAIEMAAILIDIQPGDEVIIPSYTFVSTANAFVLRGAKIIFVDIRPDTMNIDEEKIEQAITLKTKAIVPVHYAGVACEMDTIMEIANRYNLYVIEDAAQGVMSTYKGKKLGTIGHLGAYSFHETKNYTSGGEGGLLLINDDVFVERAEIIREKGTNRSQFIEGIIDKYTWVDIGSSYLPSEIQSAYLYAQLKMADYINKKRLDIWNLYFHELSMLADDGYVTLPFIPDDCNHNAHMFYLKLKDSNERSLFINYLKSKGVSSVFHYIPLHSSPAGELHGRFHGEDLYTTKESQRLVRIPIYFNLSDDDIKVIIKVIKSFFYNK